MFDISNEGIISVNRGDSFEVTLFINAGTEISPERYTLAENDTLYFAVMEPNQRFEDAILKKMYTSDSDKTEDGDIIIAFYPNDTEYLLPGKYYYTAKLRSHIGEGDSDNDYEVQTVIPQKEFFITR